MTQGTRGSRSGRRTAHPAFGFAPLALIATCVALWACALTSSALAGGSPSIQVTQCTGDPNTDPAACDSKPTTVQAAPPAQRPASRPAPRPAPPTETHSVTLTNGNSKVQKTDGTKQAETVK